MPNSRNSSQNNSTVLCPAEDCKEVFNRKPAFVRHCREEHKMEDLFPEDAMNEAEYEEV